LVILAYYYYSKPSIQPAGRVPKQRDTQTHQAGLVLASARFFFFLTRATHHCLYGCKHRHNATSMRRSQLHRVRVMTKRTTQTPTPDATVIHRRYVMYMYSRQKVSLQYMCLRRWVKFSANSYTTCSANPRDASDSSTDSSNPQRPHSHPVSHPMGCSHGVGGSAHRRRSSLSICRPVWPSVTPLVVGRAPVAYGWGSVGAHSPPTRPHLAVYHTGSLPVPAARDGGFGVPERAG
jgi:hypothetical protein